MLWQYSHPIEGTCNEEFKHVYVYMYLCIRVWMRDSDGSLGAIVKLTTLCSSCVCWWTFGTYVFLLSILLHSFRPWSWKDHHQCEDCGLPGFVSICCPLPYYNLLTPIDLLECGIFICLMMMTKMMTMMMWAMFTALRYHHSSPVLSWTGVHCNGVHTQNLGDDDDDGDNPVVLIICQSSANQVEGFMQNKLQNWHKSYGALIKNFIHFIFSWCWTLCGEETVSLNQK